MEQRSNDAAAKDDALITEGCTNIVINRGVCIRHGAKIKKCSSEGCTNQVQRGGVCMRHGAKVNLSDAAVKDAPSKPLDKESVGSMVQAALFTTRPLLLDQNSRRLPQLQPIELPASVERKSSGVPEEVVICQEIVEV
eukprot:scaffold5219_cov148-Skeletonema_dohrnii-CCMP3373.AAC.9